MKKLTAQDKENFIDTILSSALYCLQKQGVKNVRMADIAGRSGFSRPLIYQYFKDKKALIDACVDKEFERITVIFNKNVSKDAPFSEAFIQSTVIAVKLVKDRPWLREIFENIALKDYPAVLLNKDRAFNKQLTGWWLPVFERARKTGELSRRFSDKDLIEWHLNLTYMILMRENISEEQQRSFLTNFVLPALHD